MASVLCDLGVAARAIYNNKILLVKEARGRFQNKWGLPKGSVDEGETQDAVIRELTEETRLWFDYWFVSGEVNNFEGQTSQGC